MLLLSQDYGKHLLGVEDLLQKHALVEADIAIQADRVRNVNSNAQKFAIDDEGKWEGLDAAPFIFNFNLIFFLSFLSPELAFWSFLSLFPSLPPPLVSLSCGSPSLSSPSPGYKPCDPQVIRDRVAHMDFCYQELSQLAAERRARLEESRRLWKFFWEMAEEVRPDLLTSTTFDP